MAQLVEVNDLSIGFRDGGAVRPVVDGVSFSIGRGEVMALVGESGSGKTLTARAIPRLLPDGAVVTGGSTRFAGEDLAAVSETRLRALRGAKIGMIFQEPMVSLNPALTIGRQLCEALLLHKPQPREAVRRQALEMLVRVGVSEPERRLAQYPHEFSGGMRQRIMIASVMLPRPDILIADEPTTALDAIIQRDVMDLMLDMTREIGAAVLLITHDLGVVADYADALAVMRDGRVVESGPASDTLAYPRHDYTKQLLKSLPGKPEGTHIDSAKKPPLVSFDGVGIDFARKKPWPWSPRRYFHAVRGVDLDIGAGETVAIVGESGSGKTTLGRSVLGLIKPASGRVIFDGAEIGARSKRPFNHFHDRIQLIFQDPYSSLDPRMRLGAIVAEALRLSGMSKVEKLRRALSALEEAGLPQSFAGRFPHQLSGGQRQRVCIARALACNPDLVVADEPVSALDLTVQAQIIALLKELKERRGFTLIFISHDLAVVQEIADRVAVMRQGRILEVGPAERLFDAPAHPYTQALLSAAPFLSIAEDSGAYQLRHRAPKPAAPPEGHSYFDPDTAADGDRPLMHDLGAGHRVAVTDASSH